MSEAAAPAPYRTRLSILFARAAAKAVILRRGPRNHWHLIDWDLTTDALTHGQWMKGDVVLCDLSPDGRKLIYFASQYHRPAMAWRRSQTGPFDPVAARPIKKLRKGRKLPRYLQGSVERAHPARLDETWTAISTPPYFTALALWPAFGRWTGGGFFETNRKVFIGEPADRMTAIEHVPLAQGVEFVSYRSMSAEALGAHFMGCRPAAPPPALLDSQRAGLLAAGAQWVDFVFPRSERELLFGCDGCLYRLMRWRDVRPECLLAEASLIADFRDMRFTLVPPPDWAMRW